MSELKLLPLQAGETVEQKVLEFRERNDLVRNINKKFNNYCIIHVNCITHYMLCTIYSIY